MALLDEPPLQWQL